MVHHEMMLHSFKNPEFCNQSEASILMTTIIDAQNRLPICKVSLSFIESLPGFNIVAIATYLLIK